MHAYRYLATCRDWSYYLKHLRVRFSDSYNTGTIEYDHEANGNVSGATNASPIVITTSAAHGLSSGWYVTIQGVSGNTAANGTWAITVVTTTTFSLTTSVGNGTYTSNTGKWNSDRQVTLTTGTWPSWTVGGRIILDSVIHDIERRHSDTIITLDADKNPGEDVAASTSYTLVRTDYQLPDDFQGTFAPKTENLRAMGHMSNDDTLFYERTIPDESGTWYWTIMRDPVEHGRFILRTRGYPDDDESLDMIYQGRPRDPRFSGYESNNINSSSSSIAISYATPTTVTGTSTTFTSNMRGEVLRISSDANHPTGMMGLNPFAEQDYIREVQTSTKLILENSIDDAAGYSGKGFTISSPLDMPEDMHPALLACGEWFLASTRRDKAWVELAEGKFMRLLKNAMERDSRIREARCKGYSNWLGPDKWAASTDGEYG